VLDAQGITVEKFQQFADRLTLSNDTELTGRINVNTAPREVLEAIVPGENDEQVAELVDAILQAREDAEVARAGIGWLLQLEQLREDPTGGGLLPYSRMRILSQLVTTRSEQFRVQALGWTRGRTAFARIEAVLDRRSGAGKIVWIRDIGRLGLPAPLPEDTDTPESRRS